MSSFFAVDAEAPCVSAAAARQATVNPSVHMAAGNGFVSFVTYLTSMAVGCGVCCRATQLQSRLSGGYCMQADGPESHLQQAAAKHAQGVHMQVSDVVAGQLRHH